MFSNARARSSSLPTARVMRRGWEFEDDPKLLNRRGRGGFAEEHRGFLGDLCGSLCVLCVSEVRARVTLESIAPAKQDLSRDYFERSLRVAPGGVHSPVRAFKSVGGTPIFFRSAQGAILTSVDGRDYIDFCQSFGPLMLGHRDPDVAEVVNEMIGTAWSF